MLARELADAGGVVAVFVRDQYAGEIGGCEIQAREPAFGLAQRIAAVQHQARAAPFDDERIAPAAATQAGKAHGLFQLFEQQG